VEHQHLEQEGAGLLYLLVPDYQAISYSLHIILVVEQERRE